MGFRRTDQRIILDFFLPDLEFVPREKFFYLFALLWLVDRYSIAWSSFYFLDCLFEVYNRAWGGRLLKNQFMYRPDNCFEQLCIKYVGYLS